MGLPREFRLFKNGANETRDRDFTPVFDGKAAAWIFEHLAASGQSSVPILSEHKGLPVGSCFLEVRNGELWAASVKWLPAAEPLVATGRHFFSPHIKFEKKTGRLMKLFHVALTEKPRLVGLKALPLDLDPCVAPAAVRPDIIKLLAAIETSSDYEELRAALGRLYGEMRPKKMGALVVRALTLAELTSSSLYAVRN